MKGILGTNIGMTQIWKGDRAVPVTVVLAGPCHVVQRKTAATDGYEAVQVGFMPKVEKRINRPQMGHLKKAGVKVEAQYWTTGAFDGVLIFSAEVETDALRCLAALAVAGNVRTETLKAFNAKEFDAIAGK